MALPVERSIWQWLSPQCLHKLSLPGLDAERFAAQPVTMVSLGRIRGAAKTLLWSILLMSELNSNWGGTRSERIELPIPSRSLPTSSDSEHSQKNMSFLCPRSLVASTIFNIYILICEEWPQWLDAECVGGSWRRQDSDSLGNEVKWQMRHGWGVYSGKVGHMQLLEGDALTHTELLINGLGWPTKAWVWPECVLLKFRGEAVCLCLCIVILWW